MTSVTSPRSNQTGNVEKDVIWRFFADLAQIAVGAALVCVATFADSRSSWAFALVAATVVLLALRWVVLRPTSVTPPASGREATP